MSKDCKKTRHDSVLENFMTYYQDKLEAVQVARAYTHVPLCINYLDKTSLVVSITFNCKPLAYATQCNLELHQKDFKV